MERMASVGGERGEEKGEERADGEERGRGRAAPPLAMRGGGRRLICRSALRREGSTCDMVRQRLVREK